MGIAESTQAFGHGHSEDILERARYVGLAGKESSGKNWFAAYSPDKMIYEISRRENMTPMRLIAKDMNTDAIQKVWVNKWDIVGARLAGAAEFNSRRCIFGGVELSLTSRWENLHIEEDSQVTVEDLDFLLTIKPVSPQKVKATEYGSCVIDIPIEDDSRGVFSCSLDSR